MPHHHHHHQEEDDLIVPAEVIKENCGTSVQAAFKHQAASQYPIILIVFPISKTPSDLHKCKYHFFLHTF